VRRCAVEKPNGVFYEFNEGVVAVDVFASVKWPLFHEFKSPWSFFAIA
jgi:hypothetical protein